MQERVILMDLDKKKVLIGFSGGVDSTASTILLRERGFEVQGIFFNVFGNVTDTQKRAQAVARKLEMPLITLDISKYFKQKIMDYFYEEYTKGRTPNPCVQCNKHIKFSLMLEQARKINAYYIATGHYARIEFDESINKYIIRKPAALYKDQTYMLYNLNQDMLKHIIFPLGDMISKDKVREMVSRHGLPNAQTKDSQEICFIQDDDYIRFICENYDYKPQNGSFIDIKGSVLGTHSGIINYTIGQRKGLGIAFGKPVYVTHIDSENNTVTLGNNEELFTDTVFSKDNNFIHILLNGSFEAEGKIRYSAKPAKSIVFAEKNGILKTVFNTPQRAATPGQSIVFYDNDILLGGGTIF